MTGDTHLCSGWWCCCLPSKHLIVLCGSLVLIGPFSTEKQSPHPTCSSITGQRLPAECARSFSCCAPIGLSSNGAATRSWLPGRCLSLADLPAGPDQPREEPPGLVPASEIQPRASRSTHGRSARRRWSARPGRHVAHIPALLLRGLLKRPKLAIRLGQCSVGPRKRGSGLGAAKPTNWWA